MSNNNKRGARGGGSIRKRSDGRWEARYTVGIDPETGKSKCKSIYGKTQKEVRQKLTQVTAELDEGTYIEPSKTPLSEWLETWLETYVRFSVKPYTFDSYTRVCEKHIDPVLGSRKLSELNPTQIQQFYNRLLSVDGLSPKTIKNIHGVLHRALQQALKLGMIKQNPSDLCDLPKVQRKEIKPLEQEDIARLVEVVQNHPFGILYQVTLFTGLRQGEVLGLTWDCVDFERNTILINKQLQKTKKVGGEYTLAPTKSSRSRTITAAQSVMRLLKKQRVQQIEKQLKAGQAWDNRMNLVFTNDFGGHLVHLTVYKHFKDIVKSLGLDEARFHDLRHSYAVVAIESGDDIKTVQSNLGHATASFTLDVYGHVSQNMRRQSAERMDKFIRKVSGGGY